MTLIMLLFNFTITTFDKIRRFKLFFLINFIVNQKRPLFRYLHRIYCFVHLSKRSFARMLFASLFLVCSGCANQVLHIDQTNVDGILKSFEAGTMELNLTSIDHDNYRAKTRELYAKKDWESLAKAVIEGGSNQDIDWFYLGRSAEGLKLYIAAKSYYTKGISAEFKCDKMPTGCDGFSFPRDINARMELIFL